MKSNRLQKIIQLSSLATIALSLLLAVPAARAQIVFNNLQGLYIGTNATLIDRQTAYFTDTVEFGDEIVLSPAISATLTNFSFQFYSTNLPASGATMEFKLYANNGTNYGTNFSVPGTVLYDSGSFGISSGDLSDSSVHTFTFDSSIGFNVYVPANFTWTVQFANLAGGTAGLVMYDPFSAPETGTDYAGLWVASGGGWDYLTPTNGPNINFGAIAIASGSGASPSLALSKTITSGSPYAAGGVISYKLIATNTGNVTLTDVSISDPLLGALTGTQPATLLPGQTLTVTGSYTALQSDFDSGSINNTATVNGTNSSTGVSAVANATATASTQTPALAVSKSIASGSPYSVLNGVIHYQLVASNTGNVTLTNVTISDSSPGTLTGVTAATLLPGKTLTNTFDYSVTQTDLDLGSVTNSATVTGQDTHGGSLTNTASVTATATQTAQLALSKVFKNGNPYLAVGSAVNYYLTVTNTGNVTLTNVTIVDPLGTILDPGTLAPATFPVTLLPGQATLSYILHYNATQTDFDRGAITNTATASGNGPQGGLVSAQATQIAHVTTGAQRPAIIFGKRITSGSPYSVRNGAINYQLVATNTGNVTLMNVSISDPLLGSLTGPQPVSLLPNQTLTMTGTYRVTLADLDRGTFTNTAIAQAQDSYGVLWKATNSATATATKKPAVSVLDTIVSGNPYTAVGGVMSYQWTATNSGNVTITNVALFSTITNTTPVTYTVSNFVATLAAGSTLTLTGSYTNSQTDLDRGFVTNYVNVSAIGTNNAISGKSNVKATATQSSVLALSKTITSGSPYAAGGVINYQLIATNTGNVTLTGVKISDPLLGALTGTQPVTLSPNATLVMTGSYTATQTDFDRGSIINTATVTGTNTLNGQVSAQGSATATASTQTQTLALINTITGGNPYSSLGDLINYQLIATNTGNVTLSNVTIIDPLVGTLTGSNAWTLLPGQTLTNTGSYTVTQTDLDRGYVTNTATVSGQDTYGVPVTVSATNSVTATATQTPALALTKTIISGNPYSAVGNLISYRLAATNTGNVTLTNVTISDSKLGTTLPSTLSPGQPLIVTGNYTVTQTDLDRGSVTNTATVAGNDPQGGLVNATSSVTATATQSPALALSKTITSGNPYSAAGNVISYRLIASNTGNVTITTVTIDDPMLGTSSSVTLVPNQTLTVTGNYTVTPTDMTNGTVTNTATVSGNNPLGGLVTATASVTATLSASVTDIYLTSPMKSGNDFSFAFTNTPALVFSVLFSTNINNTPSTNWTSIGTASEVSAGHYSYTDIGRVTNSSKAFYRVKK